MKMRYDRMGLHHVIGPNIHPRLSMCCPCDGRNALLISATLSAGFVRYSGVQFGTNAIVHSVHEQQLQIDARPAAEGLPIKAAKAKMMKSRGVSTLCAHREGSARPSCFQSPSTAQCGSSMKGCLKASITFFCRGL